MWFFFSLLRVSGVTLLVSTSDPVQNFTPLLWSWLWATLASHVSRPSVLSLRAGKTIVCRTGFEFTFSKHCLPFSVSSKNLNNQVISFSVSDVAGDRQPPRGQCRPSSAHAVLSGQLTVKLVNTESLICKDTTDRSRRNKNFRWLLTPEFESKKRERKTWGLRGRNSPFCPDLPSILWHTLEFLIL